MVPTPRLPWVPGRSRSSRGSDRNGNAGSQRAGVPLRQIRALRALLAYCLFVLTPMSASPQAQARSGVLDSADALDEQATAAYERGTRAGAERALLLFARAAELYRRAGATGKAGEALVNVGYLHNSLGRVDSALAYYGQALRSLRLAGDRKSEAATLTQIGEAHHGLGQVDSAVWYYREAMQLAQALGDSQEKGYALNDIGSAYLALGRPDSALSYLREALSIRRQIRDSIGEGVTLNNIARVHQTLGRPDSAIVYLRQSLEIRRRIRDRGGEGVTLNNLALSFELLRQNDSALANYRQALLVLREVGRRSTVGITLANMGRVWLELGRLDSALAYLNDGLAVKREVGDKSGETWALNDLGRTYQALGRPDTAVKLLGQALGLLRAVGDRAREGETLYNLAQVFHRSLRDFQTAAAYYDSAAAVRVEVGGFAGSDLNRLSFAEQDVRLYENWALVWLSREDKVGAQAAALASLAAAERGRAQALLDLIRASAGQSSPRAGGKPGARQPTAPPHAPGADLAAEGTRLADAARRSGAAVLYYLVTPDTLLVWLVQPTGEVRVSRQAIGRDSLAALVGALRGGLGVADVASSDVAFGAVAGLEDGVGRPVVRRGLRFAESAARTLAELLLPPAFEERLDSATELVIVPQGPLALVPFACLPLGRSRTALAEPFGTRHPIRYVPSLASWSEAEARPGLRRDAQRAAELRRALVVGNPTMPTVIGASGREVSLAPLPNAEVEARWLASRLGATALTADRASEAAVRVRLPSAPLIHLATHGYAFASEGLVRKSFVALAPGSGHDGVLTVGEILDDSALTLSAELVTLSACQTGLGDLKQAEGTVGLQRAFLAKGARSVLVSLWSVSDVVTNLLMRRFYSHWLEDRDAPSKADALRRAQDDVRRTPGYTHPRFWAAFQLVGAR